MAGKSKISRWLKSKGSSQNEAAAVLGINKSSFSLKANGFSDKEKKKLAEHYAMTDEEIKELF